MPDQDDTTIDPGLVPADAFDDDGENTPIEDPDDVTEVIDGPDEDSTEDPDFDESGEPGVG